MAFMVAATSFVAAAVKSVGVLSGASRLLATSRLFFISTALIDPSSFRGTTVLISANVNA
jgi:hypothetical protein